MSDAQPHPSGVNDPARLRSGQYATAGNLNARIALHTRFSTNPADWQRFLFDHQLALVEHLPALPTPARNPVRVLEVGCGPATLWVQNLDRVPAAWQVTLTDLSPGMVAQAAAALAGAPQSGAAQFRFEEADASALPFADGAFDLVLANHMLYHVPHVPATLAELRRVLAAGGRLLAATNGEGHMAQQWQLVADFAGVESNTWHTVLTRAFSLQNGAALLRAHFAHVERHDYPDALVVTEVQPLVDYVASMDLVPSAELPAFADFVATRMHAAGRAIRIEKETGLFIAW